MDTASGGQAVGLSDDEPLLLDGDLRVMSRSQAMSADFRLCRSIPETRCDQALCGMDVSAVPGRFRRSQESWHPCGTHGPARRDRGWVVNRSPDTEL